MEINDEEHGSVIWVGGVQWVGIISLGGGAWLAYELGDHVRKIRMCIEDEQL
jgi:hypothetical protein